MDGTTPITPFWNRIPRIFLYGLHPTTLLLAGALATANYLFGGPLFNLVLYVVAIKYAAEALQHTANGELSPPKLSAETINENFELPFKLFVVFLCYTYLIGHLMDEVGMVLAILIFILSQLLLPAVIVSLVITEEIGYALNPINWFNIPLRIGWPYLIMVVFMILLDSIDYTLTALLSDILPDRLVEPFWIASYTYFITVTYHLMGYVIMQYHEELGTEPPAAQNDNASTTLSSHTTALLERFIEEGNVAAAIAELSALIENNPDDMELRRRMYVYLKSQGQDEHLQRYTPHYFKLLAARGLYREAAPLLIEAQERGAPFSPNAPADYLPVMRELRHRRAHKQAVLLAQGFHKRFPNDPLTPELYLEMAKVLSEELHRDDLAQQALNFLLKQFPDHAVIPQIQQYLALLSRLQGATTPG